VQPGIDFRLPVSYPHVRYRYDLKPGLHDSTSSTRDNTNTPRKGISIVSNITVTEKWNVISNKLYLTFVPGQNLYIIKITDENILQFLRQSCSTKLLMGEDKYICSFCRSGLTVPISPLSAPPFFLLYAAGDSSVPPTPPPPGHPAASVPSSGVEEYSRGRVVVGLRTWLLTGGPNLLVGG
jgi:hypothetical protein